MAVIITDTFIFLQLWPEQPNLNQQYDSWRTLNRHLTSMDKDKDEWWNNFSDSKNCQQPRETQKHVRIPQMKTSAFKKRKRKLYSRQNQIKSNQTIIGKMLSYVIEGNH